MYFVVFWSSSVAKFGVFKFEDAKLTAKMELNK